MIRIQWSVTTSQRADDTGGDTAVMDFHEILIDATVTEATDVSATATEHPVEDGADITDHVHPDLRKITLDCVVTNTPINDAILSGSVAAISVSLPDLMTIEAGATEKRRSTVKMVAQKLSAVSVLQFSEEKDRVKEVVAMLEELTITGTRVDILGLRFGDLYDRIITSINPTVEDNDGVRFTLTAQEIRTARTTRVAAPSPRVERARRAVAAGQQSASSGSETTEAQQRANRSSFARNLLQSALGG